MQVRRGSMNRFLASWCLCLFAIFPASWSTADPLVVEDAPRYGLGGHLELLSDATGVMTLAQVMDGTRTWRLSPVAEPNLGFSSGVSWARFQIDSRTDHKLLLAYEYAAVDFVDVFVVHADGRQERIASGDHIPFRARLIPHPYPLFPLGLTRGETAWCYVRVSNDNTIFPLVVWSESAFWSADRDRQILMGMFFGLFLFIVLLNAPFYMATRDRAYLYYIAFVLADLVFELAFRGIGGEYLWPQYTWIDDSVEVCAASLAMTMGVFFARIFLKTKAYSPVLDRILGALALILAANTLGALFLPFEIMDVVSNLLLLTSAILLSAAGFIVLLRGYSAARFYLAAWLFLFLGAIVFALFNLGLLPCNEFTTNSLSIGSSAQMVFLFFAIVDRIMFLRRESEKSQRERLQAVEKSLYHDALTDVPNRNRLIEDLRPGRLVTAAIVNIDQFKEINDSFGQKVGDYVIRELSKRIRTAVAGRAAEVYRLHADEFAVLINEAYDADQINEVGHSLTAQCQDLPYVYETETLRLNVSIGIAVTDVRHLEKADMALSAARSQKTFVAYRPELEVGKQYADNLHWLHVIREAIEQDRIIPYFQPILNNARGIVEKFESLMRIRAADGRIIPPGAFFAIAKKSKLYPDLSRAMIEKTALMMRGDSREASINVSREDIVNPGVLEVIDRVVLEQGLGPRTVFELLESEGIENYAEVSHFIARMKSRGCKIAIDDFGTGYSNFEHILRLNVDYLKLDASLIKPIATDVNARSIVETIVSFAGKLGIQTIAEFVHNEAVQTIVRSIGVDHSQGYFISEPRPDMSFVFQALP
jgi:diguanylate cyclase (GGDEF)-like protein